MGLDRETQRGDREIDREIASMLGNGRHQALVYSTLGVQQTPSTRFQNFLFGPQTLSKIVA